MQIVNSSAGRPRLMVYVRRVINIKAPVVVYVGECSQEVGMWRQQNAKSDGADPGQSAQEFCCLDLSLALRHRLHDMC